NVDEAARLLRAPAPDAVLRTAARHPLRPRRGALAGSLAAIARGRDPLVERRRIRLPPLALPLAPAMAAAAQPGRLPTPAAPSQRRAESERRSHQSLLGRALRHGGRPARPGAEVRPAFRRIAVGPWDEPRDPTIYASFPIRMERTLEYLQRLRESSGVAVTLK